MNLRKGETTLWLEFSAEMTEQVEQAEQGNIPLQFYNLKSQCYQGIHTCEGDMVVICNTLADYVDLMMEFIRQSDYEGYQKAFYEVHARRCQKISLKLQEQIGYDREAAIERCQAKRKYYEENGDAPDNDVGEEALVMMVKRAREKAKQEEMKKNENHVQKDEGGDLNDGGE